jgi:hypothetical protein
MVSFRMTRAAAELQEGGGGRARMRWWAFKKMEEGRREPWPTAQAGEERLSLWDWSGVSPQRQSAAMPKELEAGGARTDEEGWRRAAAKEEEG